MEEWQHVASRGFKRSFPCKVANLLTPTGIGGICGLGCHEASVRGGSLESSSPFCVVRKGEHICFGRNGAHLRQGLSLRGGVDEHLKVWGQDARAELTAPALEVQLHGIRATCDMERLL